MSITIVKFGGSLSKDEKSTLKFLDDLAKTAKKSKVIMVHGGGPEINTWLAKAGIEPKFVNGLRFTDKKTLEIVEMVLSGKVNKYYVSELVKRGVNAAGISGKDGKTLICNKVKGLGFVGEPCLINSKLIDVLVNSGFVPVISSLGLSKSGQTLNVNADSIAMALAVKLKAAKLILLTNVPGVLDGEKKLIPLIFRKDVKKLIKAGIITGGMIPKIRACGQAVLKGVKEVVIADGSSGLLNLRGTVIRK